MRICTGCEEPISDYKTRLQFECGANKPWPFLHQASIILQDVTPMAFWHTHICFHRFVHSLNTPAACAMDSISCTSLASGRLTFNI